MEQTTNRQPAVPQNDSGVSSQINEAVFNLVQEVLPLLGDNDNRDLLLRQLDRCVLWLRLLPRSLTEKKWTYQEFEAALAGPEALAGDPRFGAYMEAFYEEHKEDPEEELQSFYDTLFQNEHELSKVDWSSVWETVRTGYETWLETTYADEWLQGEKKD